MAQKDQKKNFLYPVIPKSTTPLTPLDTVEPTPIYAPMAPIKNPPSNTSPPFNVPKPPVSNEPKRNEWSDFTYDNLFAYNFCGCCEDVKLCCLGTFCLPCLICSLYIDAKEGCCAGCWQCFTCVVPINLCCCSNMSFVRSKIRGAFKIHGSLMEDIYYSHCCPCCSVIQMKLELRSRGLLDNKGKSMKNKN